MISLLYPGQKDKTVIHHLCSYLVSLHSALSPTTTEQKSIMFSERLVGGVLELNRFGLCVGCDTVVGWGLGVCLYCCFIVVNQQAPSCSADVPQVAWYKPSKAVPFPLSKVGMSVSDLESFLG